jgi:hypothetical protein
MPVSKDKYRLRDGWKDYGNLSAVDPPYQRAMQCDDCKTKWMGCWDNFTCPECGEGELPKSSVTPGNYVCCDCLKLFNTLEDMQRHNEKVHP